MDLPGFIVPAGAQDAESIHEITASAGNFSPEEVATVDELFGEYLQQGGKAGDYNFLVYREDGGVLGYACYGPRPLTQGTYDLYWLATNPRCQKRGIGLALLRRVEEEVRRLGGRLLVIETSGREDYQSVRRFYLNAGCILASTIRDFYKPGDDLVLFVRYV
ncbi:MAG: GNAT family N-acetyltransferase [Anaerolineae bacterium]|nr:GNAT family N-acetyltransferase [Anaerolineae bacterium]